MNKINQCDIINNFEYYNNIEEYDIKDNEFIKNLNFSCKSDNFINPIREYIRFNNPIEDKLNVIIVMSNVCGFRKRVQLAKEFILRMNYEKYVELFIVELAYDNNPVFEITTANNKNHLQLRTKDVLWHKENMINIAVWKLLPENWKAFAWIDSDIEFENESWAIDTLKLLNSLDVIQLFSHYNHLNKDKTTLLMNSSFGYQYIKKNKFCFNARTPNFWHPGFAWAMTRKTFQRIRGLFQLDIMGGGDYHFAMALITELKQDDNNDINDDMKNEKKKYFKRCYGLKLGYVPGLIRHHYHGTIKNRQYKSRYEVLKNNNFNLKKHITFNKEGIMVPTKECPRKLLDDMYTYFSIRNEDND